MIKITPHYKHFHLVKIYYRDYRHQKEEFEDTKGVIRICKSKNYRQHNGQKKKEKRKTTIYKTYT